MKIAILGALTSLVQRHDTELRPVDIDEANGTFSNLAIDSGLRRISSNRFSPFTENAQVSPVYRLFTRVTDYRPVDRYRVSGESSH